MSAAVPMLERAMVWDPAGHLAEAAVAALADGELAILPPDAVQHGESCPLCAERVGQAALFALELAEALDPALTHALAGIAAPQHAIALVPATALARVEVDALAVRSDVGSSSRPPYGRTSSSFAPPSPLPVKAVVAALLVALVAGGPWLSNLQPGSLAERLGQLARLLTHAVAAARAPGVAELAWAAAGVLGLVGVLVARVAARQRGRLIEGMR